MQFLRAHLTAVVAVIAAMGLVTGVVLWRWPRQAGPTLRMSILSTVQSGDQSTALDLEALYDNELVGAYWLRIWNSYGQIELGRADLTLRPQGSTTGRLSAAALGRTLTLGDDARGQDLASDLEAAARRILTHDPAEDGSLLDRSWGSSADHDAGKWYETGHGTALPPAGRSVAK